MAKNYKARKIIKSVIWIVVLLGIAFGIFFVVKNKDALWGKVTDNTNIYTQEQLDQEKDKAYNQGYLDAHTNNIELKKQVEQYLETIANRDKTITEKENIITENNQTIEANKTVIEEHKAEIERLKAQAETTNQNHAQAIAELETEISSLQLINDNLQKENATNLATITELNNEKTTLENKVTELSAKIEENNQLIAEYEQLKADKEALENSQKYYEDFIKSLETETQAVAIFEVEGSVYNAQILAKGSSPTITKPADTETTTFVGWYVNNILIENINTYQITTNTKFVAKFDIAYTVNFKLDENSEFTSIKVAKNGYATELITLPTKTGYDFDGFTINGVDVIDYTTHPITENTTFIAKFTKLHTVTFVVKDKVVATQKIRNGENAQEVQGYTNEWLLNGEAIDITNYPVYADLTFFQNNFLKSLQEYSFNFESGISNYLIGSKTWTDKKGNVYLSNGSAMQYAFNKENNTWYKKTWVGLTNINADYIWESETKVYYSYQSDQYLLSDDNITWVPITWNGQKPSLGTYVWNYSGETYYSNGSKRYKLDESSITWNLVQNDNKTGTSIWVDSDKIYSSSSSSQFKFDEASNTWVSKVWNGLTSFDAKYVWRDCYNNVYYSKGSEQYTLNKATDTWVVKTWENVTTFNADNIVIIDNNIYLLNGASFYIFN